VSQGETGLWLCSAYLKKRPMDPSILYSILDLAILREGYDERDAYHRTLDLAQQVEQMGFLASSFYQLALGIVRGKSYLLKHPIPEMSAVWTEREKAAVENMLAYSFIGTPKSVRPALERFITKGYVDELMVSCNMYDHEDRLTSYRLVRNLMQKIRKNACLLD
jgi:alkanesulfonate monooxygenase SsuD/methylene tetrahydromethanopterin reductase-like flavin-dependent oxidoreductase (luciferase family)